MIQLNKQLLVIVMVGMGLILILMTRFGLLKDGKLQVPEVPFIGGDRSAEEVVVPQVSETDTQPTPTTPRTSHVSAGSTLASDIAFVAPADGDVWSFDTLHTILWNKEPGEMGNMYLVNVDTNELAGWVLPVSTAKQVSYAWNTRDLSEGIIGGTSINVQPGRYYLTLSLSGNHPDVRSSIFRIQPAGFAERVTHVVSLKNVSVSPPQLEVPRGTSVAFVNYDTSIHTLTTQGSFGPFTLAPNGIYTLNTLTLQPGTYNYYSNVWTYQAPGTLIVK